MHNFSIITPINSNKLIVDSTKVLNISIIPNTNLIQNSYLNELGIRTNTTLILVNFQIFPCYTPNTN